MRLAKVLATAASACLVVSTTVPMLPAFAQSASRKIDQKQAEIPSCSHKIGTLAVREPDTRWWKALARNCPRGAAEGLCDEVQAFHPGGPRQGF
ncbi:MAG: hypothetical protein U1E93_00800 [Alphaproteobacteria bacterium]